MDAARVRGPPPARMASVISAMAMRPVHATSFSRPSEPAFGITWVASVPSHCSSRLRVDAAEVDRHREVVLGVELGQVRVVAQHAAAPRACPAPRRRRRRRGRCRRSRSASGRRPNSDQTSVSTRSATPRASRSAWKAASALADLAPAPLPRSSAWLSWVSKSPSASTVTARIPSGSERSAGEHLEAVAEVALGVGDGARQRVVAVVVLLVGREDVRHALGQARGRVRGGRAGRRRAPGGDRRPGLHRAVEGVAPEAGDPELRVVGRGHRGHRRARRSAAPARARSPSTRPGAGCRASRRGRASGRASRGLVLR